MSSANRSENANIGSLVMSLIKNIKKTGSKWDPCVTLEVNIIGS